MVSEKSAKDNDICLICGDKIINLSESSVSIKYQYETAWIPKPGHRPYYGEVRTEENYDKEVICTYIDVTGDGVVDVAYSNAINVGDIVSGRLQNGIEVGNICIDKIQETITNGQKELFIVFSGEDVEISQIGMAHCRGNNQDISTSRE